MKTMQLAYAGIIAAFLYSFFAVLPVETFTVARVIDAIRTILGALI